MAFFGLTIICFLSTFVINFSLLVIAQPPIPYLYHVYLYHYCSGGNYTANSAYDTNLNVLLSSLSSNGITNSINRNGYYNSTAGRSTDTVYGALQCRGDVTSEICRNCVDRATQEIRKEDKCPISKEAIIWYDDCMLRYSDRSFFAIMQEDPYAARHNPYNVINPARFNQILIDLLDDIISEAVVSRSLNNTLFATGDRSFTTFQQVYGLVQCTSDIGPASCNRCLRTAITKIPWCCEGYQGGMLMKPSCNFRFETYPFYQSKPSSPPPALLPALNTTSTKGIKGKSSAKNGKTLELLNPSLRERCPRSEVTRCVHIGLLCVQEDVAERPTMASIVLMLNSDSVTLPLPSPPAYFVQSRKDPNLFPEDTQTVTLVPDQSMPWTVNDESITELYPRS